MESNQQTKTRRRLPLVWSVMLDISGFAIFLGLTFLLVRIFLPANEYEDTRGQERLEKRLEIEETGNASLDSYAWINQEEGTVRIPVSQAALLVMDELNAKPVQVSSVPVPGTPAADAALRATAGGSTETGAEAEDTAETAETADSPESEATAETPEAMESLQAGEEDKLRIEGTIDDPASALDSEQEAGAMAVEEPYSPASGDEESDTPVPPLNTTPDVEEVQGTSGVEEPTGREQP